MESRNILKIRIDGTSYEDACDRIQHYIESHQSCYIVAANVHVVMTAYWDMSYRTAIAQATLVTPDGMPLVWGLRLLGIKRQMRVYGPDLMLAWCARTVQHKLPIYLYGGTQKMLIQLSNKLTQKFPGLSIAGTHSPPFRALTIEEQAADISRIHQSGAKVVFVGLGCPKQEFWMAQQKDKLNAVLLGVGAAFAFHSGEVSQAPQWMMRLGCEWLYRFAQEPKRLWQRYLINNPAFLILFASQLFWTYLRRPQAIFQK